MKSKLFHSRISRLTLRCVFGMLLCTPAACTSAGKMVSKDPFSGKKPEFSHGQYEPTQGNHSMLEQAGIPLESQLPAVPMDNHQTSMYPQAMPVRMAPGMPPQMDTEGKVRVHNEWPAISEQTVGYRNPQAEAAPPMPEGVLPPGGYETPIGTQQPWHQTAQVETPAQSEIVQTSFEAPIVTANRKSKYTDFTPAEPRVALQPKTCQSCGGESCYCQPASWQGTPCPCPPFPTQVACTSCNPGDYPDEYLCDGGDRKDPVHYSPGAREGLDTQDTVAEYQDDTGEHHMKPTNEVCVYAPRFGAVKTVAGSSENLGVDRALGAYETVKGLAVNTRMKPNTEQQTEQLNAALVRSRASGLESEEITLGVNQATKTEHHTKLHNTFEEYAFSGQNQLLGWQTPVDTASIQAAAAWSREKSPVIVASDVAGSEVYSWFRPEEIVGLEDKKQIGKLYIDKSVDAKSAKTGDVITFTIRYRNTGERSLFNVQIIDNLTPRLEYIEGSATSNREGRLVVEDNSEGSLILKWEISEEIKGQTGGEVTFQAKVR